MSVFRNVKSRVQNLKEKIQGHHKWKMFLYAGIFILVLVYIWLFYTNTGWLARTSFFKSFNHHPDRIVRIYAGNELIEEYVGEYSIENLKTRINKVQSTISLYNREISQTKASIDSKKFLLAKIEKNAGISKFESTLYKIFIVINRFLARIFNFLLEWIQRM